MTITNLRLDESVKLEFDVLITGADGIPKTRFVIEGKDYSVSYPCRQVNGGVEVDIAGLKNIFTAGEYPVHLEVILDNKIYVPMRDKIKLDPLIEVNTKTKVSESVKESVKVFGKVNVTKKQTINEENIRHNEIALKIAEAVGYEVTSEMNASEIINNTLKSINYLSEEEFKNLEKMLFIAESYNIDYDSSLLPTTVEEKEENVISQNILTEAELKQKEIIASVLKRSAENIIRKHRK